MGDRHHRECRFGEAEAPRLFEAVHDDVVGDDRSVRDSLHRLLL